MVIAAVALLSLGPSNCQLCHADVCCSTSHGFTNSLFKSHSDSRRCHNPFSISSRNSFFGSTQFQWSSVGHDACLFKVGVAADYSDSVPNSSNYTSHGGYHPLEEVKVKKCIRETQLTSAEIARTAVEGNSTALLVFPGTVHCEPHEQITWTELHYVVDDYGDIFFEIFDGENILEDHGATNPVNVLIGMDIPLYENKRVASEYNIFNIGSGDDVVFNDDYFEVMDSEVSDVSRGMPDTSSWVHPIFFAKCLTKAINGEHDRKMDHPSNGVSIIGCLTPAFADEELYLRRLINCEDSDGYNLDWKDGEILNFSAKSDRSSTSSTLYRLDVVKIELFSVYGVQSAISLQDFQDAEPDILAHSTSSILKHFNEKGISCNVALEALCKKKGLQVEGANLIGVDSLGIDVRVFSGVEARTHRFPFKIRAKSLVTAEKQINQLLFPRSRRKKLKSNDWLGE